MKSTLVVRRCVLGFSLLALGACSHKSVIEDNNVQGQMTELQSTVRTQNKIIQDLKTQLLVLENPKVSKDKSQRQSELSGVSLASEEPIVTPTGEVIQLPQTHTAPNKFVDEKDPVKIYEASISLLQQNENDLAFEGFSKLVKTFRSHPLSDNAYFEIGKIYVSRGESERAVFHFRQMAILYPAGDRLAEGQLILAEILDQQGNKDESRKIFSSVAETFSGSSAAIKAKQKISKLDTKG